MKYLRLKCLLAISCLAFNNATAEVTVKIDQQQYVFANEPRLLEVLAPIVHQNWYWPAAALYEIDNGELEQTRQGLLKQLSALAKEKLQKDPQLTFSLEQLAVDIANWNLARRLPVAIDYDLARIKADANPQFTPGQYILRLGLRSQIVRIFGAVNYSQQVVHLPHADVSQYNTRQSLTDLADKDYVIIIQADGRVVKVPAAYWNKNHREVMPGSQLFVPFKEHFLSPQLSKINQQIVDLAINRVW
jgi:hypothetical protein